MTPLQLIIPRTKARLAERVLDTLGADYITTGHWFLWRRFVVIGPPPLLIPLRAAIRAGLRVNV